MELRREAIKYLDPEGVIFRFHKQMVLFANFWARVKKKVITDPVLILTGALELDKIFDSIFTDVPPGWRYETAYTEDSPDIVFAGYYHVYQDFMVAQIWNGMRTFRVLLNEIIRDIIKEDLSSQSPWFPRSESLAQFQMTTKPLHQLQWDIFASVPQHLGYSGKGRQREECNFPWSDFNNHWTHYDTGSFESTTSHLPIVHLSGGYMLPWPLYLAGVTDLATGEDRRWVIHCLRIVGRSIGVEQAMVLADMVEKRSRF